MMRSAKIASLWLILLAFVRLAHADGLLQKRSDGQFLRLSRTLVEVEVFDQIALTTVVHEFINFEDVDSLDVLYLFPLPANAAVTGLAVWRDSLYAEFSLAAADSGGGNQDLPGGDENPELLDYLRPNPLVVPMVLTTDTVRVRLSYAELLPFDFGAIQYRYPANSGSFDTGALDAFAILMRFSTQRTIMAIETPGFASGVDIHGPFSATIGYDAANFSAAGDFIVDYQLAQEEVGLFTLTYNDPADTTEAAGFFVSLLEPGNIQPDEILNKHFTFVLDRSGSMGGGKILQARAAARYSVEHLNANDFFNIIDFATNVRQFRNEAVPATPANIADAVAYIEQIQATGSTNINDALLAGLSQTLASEVNQIIFLTDGHATTGVTSTTQILANIRAANVHDASIFVFGVGNSVARDLLQAMADENHGVATFIAEGEPIDEVIVNFFARVSNPVLVDVSLDFGALEVFDVYPVALPDMFAGFQQVIAGRYAGPGAFDITLNGSVANADTALIYHDVVFADSSTDNVFIPKVWAKKKIDHLYARWLKEGEPEELKQEIIALSLKYGVLSPFTEFDKPDDPVTHVDGVLFTSAQAEVEGAAAEQAGVLLTWTLAGDLEAVAAVEIFRHGDSGFERLASLSGGATFYKDAEADPAQARRYRIDLVLIDGARVSRQVDYAPQLVEQFALAQNYPNPFNPETRIVFSLAADARVRLRVYNVLGEVIVELVDESLPAGRHEITWNGRDTRRRPVASGVYFYQIEAGTFKATRRMLLAR